MVPDCFLGKRGSPGRKVRSGLNPYTALPHHRHVLWVIEGPAKGSNNCPPHTAQFPWWVTHLKNNFSLKRSACHDTFVITKQHSHDKNTLAVKNWVLITALQRLPFSECKPCPARSSHTYLIKSTCVSGHSLPDREPRWTDPGLVLCKCCERVLLRGMVTVTPSSYAIVQGIFHHL